MNNTGLTRRAFVGGSAAAAAAVGMTGSSFAFAEEKPDSLFQGVQIGVITYSYRSMKGDARKLLDNIVACGISSIELMDGPAEEFAREHGGSDPMEGFRALRKLYAEAGVNIHAVKFPKIGSGKMSDADIDRCFEIAKALGARGITREIDAKLARKLGPFADRHEIMLAFHNHMQIRPDTYDGDILSHGEHLGINLDIGHYVAANDESPLPMIRKFKDRILSLHVKDRQKNKGPNRPFGEGDTPIPEILQYMRDDKVAFPADIELEYAIPSGSDAVKEIRKCVAFCREALG